MLACAGERSQWVMAVQNKGKLLFFAASTVCWVFPLLAHTAPQSQIRRPESARPEQMGRLSGTVRTTAGAALSSVHVTATNAVTGEQSGAVTENEGAFLIENLPAGTYHVTAERQGLPAVSR